MIRMDDITADMDWNKFNRIRGIFEQYHILPLLGIVPRNLDEKLRFQEEKENFWEIVRSLQQMGWSIAQHGTYHTYVTEDRGMLGLKNASEFAGLSYEEQYAKIETGKRILEENGIYTDIFMAPGHTYDKNTIKALYNLGFCTVTDGLSNMPYYYEKMLFVPCRLQEYRNVKGLDTICLHSNLMADEEIKELEAFCRKNQEYIIPFLPDELKMYARKRTCAVIISEKTELFRRRVKNKVANSVRLNWYMKYTYDKNSKIKILKRILFLPMLLFHKSVE